MVAKLNSARRRAQSRGTSGVTLTDVKREVPRLAVLGAPTIVQVGRAATGDRIQLRPEAVILDIVDDSERDAKDQKAPVVIASLGVNLAGEVTHSSETEVGARLGLGVERQQIVALAGNQRGAKHCYELYQQ